MATFGKGCVKRQCKVKIYINSTPDKQTFWLDYYSLFLFKINSDKNDSLYSFVILISIL